MIALPLLTDYWYWVGSGNEIIDSPINVNIHPVEDTILSKTELSDTQIVTLPFNWEYYSSWD